MWTWMLSCPIACPNHTIYPYMHWWCRDSWVIWWVGTMWCVCALVCPTRVFKAKQPPHCVVCVCVIQWDCGSKMKKERKRDEMRWKGALARWLTFANINGLDLCGWMDVWFCMGQPPPFFLLRSGLTWGKYLPAMTQVKPTRRPLSHTHTHTHTARSWMVRARNAHDFTMSNNGHLHRHAQGLIWMIEGVGRGRRHTHRVNIGFMIQINQPQFSPWLGCLTNQA